MKFFNKNGFALTLPKENLGNRIKIINLPLLLRSHIYIANISIGTPRQYFNFLIDTASAWLQVFSSKCKSCEGSKNFFYSNYSSTFNYSGNEILLAYSGGQSFTGTTATDNLFLESIERTNFRFNLIHSSTGISTGKVFDGILGLACNYTYYSITKMTEPESLIDSLYNNMIANKIFALYTNEIEKSGYLTLGGYNTSLAEQNNITWIDIVESENSFTWNVPLLSVADIKPKESIYVKIDTGTGAIELPESFKNEFYDKIGGKNCSTYGQVTKCHCNSIKDLKEFHINLGGFIFKFNPECYSKYKNGICKMRINFNGRLLFGYTFLKNFYVIFDKGSRKLGFIGYFNKIVSE